MACFSPENLYGIIGWPLGHSLSPLLHNTAFQSLEIPAVYMPWPLLGEDLPAFLENMRIMRVKGCSVTIPHKIAVMARLDDVSEAASLAGAVNTLYWREERLCGENTDVSGFLAPLDGLPIDKMEILLLGAGGAAHAAAAGLRLRGCRFVRVGSPGDQRQFSLAERFGFEPLMWKDIYKFPARLVINATPLGMNGEYGRQCAYDFDIAPKVPDGWAYDLVYNPLETVFLRKAEKNGWRPISGLEMFYTQGNAQFRLWTGRSLPPQSRMALEAALAKKEC